MTGVYWPTKAASIDNTGLHANFVGTVDTGILRFNVPGTLAGDGAAACFNEVDSATEGTILNLTRKGLYAVTLSANMTASGSAGFGISYNAPATSLQAADDPINTLAGILVGLLMSTAVGTTMPMCLTAIVRCTAADIQAGTAAVRFHGNDGAGGSIRVEVVEQTIRYTATYLGDLKGV